MTSLNELSARNLYAGLEQFKSFLKDDQQSDNVNYIKWLQTAARMIDRHVKREFFVATATKTFEIKGPLIFVPDLLVVTTLKSDDDGDDTYETTLAATDFRLLPRNEFPKTWIEPKFNASNFFGTQVEIVGSWGHGDGKSATPTVDSGATINEEIDTSQTEFTVTATSRLDAGVTILIESEQMYISQIKGALTFECVRAVNGTTAATHASGKAIDIYQYPEEIVDACMITASRLNTRRDTQFSNIIGSGDQLGTVAVHHGIDPDVARMLVPYMFVEVG